MRFLINVHLNDGLPDDGDELLNELEGIADDLLRTFQHMDNRPWFISSVAIQPSPRPLLNARDL